MANQYKKLQKKLYSQKNSSKKTPEPKVGKDYMLLILIVFTVFVGIAGWSQLDVMNRSMYALLTISLSLTHIRRHAKLSETMQVIVERTSLVCLGCAVIVFFVVLYQQFFG